jgi:hypothetical protein
VVLRFPVPQAPRPKPDLPEAKQLRCACCPKAVQGSKTRVKVSGATPILSALRAPGWILMSLSNLAHSSQPTRQGGARQRGLPAE